MLSHAMTLLAEALWSRIVDGTNQLATGSRYVGVRYLISFFALLVSGIKLVGPLVTDRKKAHDSVEHVASEAPSFEAAFTSLADLHIKLQQKYDSELSRNEKLERNSVEKDMQIADLLGEVTRLRSQSPPKSAPPEHPSRVELDDSL